MIDPNEKHSEVKLRYRYIDPFNGNMYEIVDAVPEGHICFVTRPYHGIRVTSSFPLTASLDMVTTLREIAALAMVGTGPSGFPEGTTAADRLKAISELLNPYVSNETKP